VHADRGAVRVQAQVIFTGGVGRVRQYERNETDEEFDGGPDDGERWTTIYGEAQASVKPGLRF